MSTKLELMIELWEEKFRPLINDYEDIEYTLNPDWKRPDDIPSDAIEFYWTWFTDVRKMFKITDLYYNRGYGEIVITTLKWNSSGEFDFEGFFIKNEYTG